jgi:hypothetical protein
MSKVFNQFNDYPSVMRNLIQRTKDKRVSWRINGNAWIAHEEEDNTWPRHSELRWRITQDETRLHNVSSNKHYITPSDPALTSELIQAIVFGLNFKQ